MVFLMIALIYYYDKIESVIIFDSQSLTDDEIMKQQYKILMHQINLLYQLIFNTNPKHTPKLSLYSKNTKNKNQPTYIKKLNSYK